MQNAAYGWWGRLCSQAGKPAPQPFTDCSNLAVERASVRNAGFPAGACQAKARIRRLQSLPGLPWCAPPLWLRLRRPVGQPLQATASFLASHTASHQRVRSAPNRSGKFPPTPFGDNFRVADDTLGNDHTCAYGVSWPLCIMRIGSEVSARSATSDRLHEVAKGAIVLADLATLGASGAVMPEYSKGASEGEGEGTCQ